MSTRTSPEKGAKNASPKSSNLWKKNIQSPVPRYYSDIDAIAIRGAIDAVTRNGGAIMFGVTSDGGAYSFMVLLGNEKIKEYPHSVEEAEELLQELLQELA